MNIPLINEIGPFQFSKDTVQEIVERCHEKIASVLESHANLDVNRSLEFFIRVLGKHLFYEHLYHHKYHE